MRRSRTRTLCVEPAAHLPHDDCPGAEWVRRAWPDGSLVLTTPREPSRLARFALILGVIMMLTALIVGAAAWVGVTLAHVSEPDGAVWHSSPGPGLSETPERVRAVREARG